MAAIDLPRTDRGPKLLEELSTQDVSDALSETDVFIFCPGAIEEHGAHLPLGTDSYIADETVRRTLAVLAERGCRAVGYVFPIGNSANLMGFPGTLTLSGQTFVQIHKEVVGCMYRHGFRKFVLLSGNGGNAVAMQLAMDEVAHAFPESRVIFLDPLPYQFAHRDGIVKNAKIDSHAAEGETAKILATRPELVQMDRAEAIEHPPRSPLANTYGPGFKRPLGNFKDFAPRGYVGDPRLAEASTGDKLFDLNARWLADVIQSEFFSGVPA
ncbi:MAG: creatininase family protein [Chloroflexi bacterium]|nr:creatininase family protein [Chloroflexota bacterium]